MLQTIGCDVEVFAKTDTKHKSLCGLIGGTKENPFQLPDLPTGYCVQEDNVSLEFNIPPEKTKLGWKTSIDLMMEKTKHILKQKGFSLSSESAAIFEKSELTHPNSLIFGCEPDYNAWTRTQNKKPVADDPFLRTAGGHVHVGTQVDMLTGIQNMDLFLGVPSILLDTSPASLLRRKLYGKAGAMRPKHYGFEYRVLSNFWCFSPELIAWVYDQTKTAMKEQVKFTQKQAKEIQRIINEGDKDAAKATANHYGIAIPVGTQ